MGLVEEIAVIFYNANPATIVYPRHGGQPLHVVVHWEHLPQDQRTPYLRLAVNVMSLFGMRLGPLAMAVMERELENEKERAP